MLTLELLESLYPGVLLIKPTEAGMLLNQSKQSTYNQVCTHRFPIQLVIDHLGRKMVRLTDLANYIDGMTVTQPLPQPPHKTKGRPKKIEQVEAQRRGFSSVRELRAQGGI